MRATHFLNVPTFIEENPEQSGGRKSAIETEKLSMKKMISWNVNGLRACLGKGFLEYLKETEADIFCIQESKLQEGQVDLASGVSPVLELRGEKGIFRNGDVYEGRADRGDLWTWNRGT